MFLIYFREIEQDNLPNQRRARDMSSGKSHKIWMALPSVRSVVSPVEIPLATGGLKKVPPAPAPLESVQL
jgi:hypothetical protein